MIIRPSEVFLKTLSRDCSIHLYHISNHRRYTPYYSLNDISHLRLKVGCPLKDASIHEAGHSCVISNYREIPINFFRKIIVGGWSYCYPHVKRKQWRGKHAHFYGEHADYTFLSIKFFVQLGSKFLYDIRNSV